MKITKQNPSGAYGAIQNWAGSAPPDGFVQITADTTEFYNGFIVPTIEDGVIVSFTEDTDARAAWLASLPAQETEPTPAQPDPTAQIQLALAELAETESAHDLENKLALAELAEMIGGTNG